MGAHEQEAEWFIYCADEHRRLPRDDATDRLQRADDAYPHVVARRLRSGADGIAGRGGGPSGTMRAPSTPARRWRVRSRPDCADRVRHGPWRKRL